MVVEAEVEKIAVVVGAVAKVAEPIAVAKVAELMAQSNQKRPSDKR